MNKSTLEYLDDEDWRILSRTNSHGGRNNNPDNIFRNMTYEEFNKHRQDWIREWADKWRHLDIDFEAYMLMKGVTPEEYKRLNEEAYRDSGDEEHLLGLS